MGLYDCILGDAETQTLTAIFKSLGSDRDTKDKIRSDFKIYVRTKGLRPLEKSVLARLLANPANATLERRLLLYDFGREVLFRSIINGDFAGKCDPETKSNIASLVKARQVSTSSVFHAFQTTWGLERVNEFSQVVPSVFIRPFFGYRRSATQGAVVRIYIRLDATENPREVHFCNYYVRRNERWKVTRVGRYINKNLYLVGHAMSLDDETSLGLRLMSIRQLGQSETLSAIVISEHEGIPIAARVLLVPVDHHKLEDTELQRKLASRVPVPLSESEIKEFSELDEITTEIRKRGSDIEDDNEFLFFIDNFTPTVLKAGREQPFNLRILSEQLYALRDYELIHTPQNEIADVLVKSVADAIKAYLLNINSKGGG